MSIQDRYKVYRVAHDLNGDYASLPQKIRLVKGGASHRYVFPKCHRVTWTNLSFTCGADGQWSTSGSWNADGLCHSSNTSQPYLYLGNR